MFEKSGAVASIATAEALGDLPRHPEFSDRRERR